MTERVLPNWHEIASNCVDRSDVEYELEDAYLKGLAAGKLDSLQAVEDLLRDAYGEGYEQGYQAGQKEDWVAVLEADEEYQKAADEMVASNQKSGLYDDIPVVEGD